MKKVVYSLLILCGVLLAGCFETTQEITISKDGSGVVINSTDMSGLLGMMKQMGGDDVQKIKNVDTSFSLSGVADSINDITPQQRKMIAQGTMSLTLNLQDEKLLLKFTLPFQKTGDLETLNQVMPKITEAAIKKLPGAGQVPAGMPDADGSKIKTFDDFYDVVFTDKLMSKTLNKDKYASGKDGDYMKSLQQLSDMGSPVKANYLINLPRPAKSAEGKAVILSADKMKVSIAVTSDDFFNDPSKFEYRIEY